MNPTKKILFIMQHSPYGNTRAREALDAALACAAFEQPVQLLFTDDGVWQLLPDQQASTVGNKDIGKMLGALAYYDINAVFTDSTALRTRNLTPADLAIQTTAVETDAMRQLIHAADCVITL